MQSQTHKYTTLKTLGGWTKQITNNGVISYLNDVHKAVHAFLDQHCVCEYKYFIYTRQWGFEIGLERKGYLFLVDNTTAIAFVALEHTALLGKKITTLELADLNLIELAVNWVADWD